MGFMDANDDQRAVDELRTDLARSFPSIPAAQRVNSTIDAELNQYDRATVRDFVPLLLQRQVAKKLRAVT
jgi:hypothetical protein